LASALAKDAFVDKLLSTQFADKAEILKRLNPTGIPKPALERQLKDFQNLRDSLAHASEYAASPEQARPRSSRRTRKRRKNELFDKSDVPTR
jgi:hypothetical protein